jgi:hypothetical protein
VAHDPAFVCAIVTTISLATPKVSDGQTPIGVLGIRSEVAPIERQLQDRREQVIRGYLFLVGTLGGQYREQQVQLLKKRAAKLGLHIVEPEAA